jgi:hypothetical protein
MTISTILVIQHLVLTEMVEAVMEDPLSRPLFQRTANMMNQIINRPQGRAITALQVVIMAAITIEAVVEALINSRDLTTGIDSMSQHDNVQTFSRPVAL